MNKPTRIGLGALEYGKFREVRKGESVVGVANEAEIFAITRNITASGATEVISAPTDEEGIRVRGFQMSKAGGSAVNISLKQDDGDNCYTVRLENDGDFISRDFSHVWALETHKALQAVASGACNVYLTVEYEHTPSRREGLKLTDSVDITEALAKDFVRPNLADTSGTITEEVEKGLVLPQADSAGAISESTEYESAFVRAETETVALDDSDVAMGVEIAVTDSSGAIAEDLEAQRSISFGDTISMNESLTVTLNPS
jgi:hypothetical protein